MAIKLEDLGDAIKFMSGWEGWSCDICQHVVGCDTSEMIEHLKTHTEKELMECLRNAQ